MKRTTAIALIFFITISVATAQTQATAPRELDNGKYFWITKIKQPVELLFSGFREEMRLKHIQEKQEFLDDVELLKDKERIIADINKDINKIKSDDQLINSGLNLIRQRMQEENKEMQESIDVEEFLGNIKTELKNREHDPSYMAFADEVFDDDVAIAIGEEHYTLKFQEGKYEGYEKEVSPQQEVIELSYSDVAEMNDALEKKQYNRFDKALAETLPPQMKAKVNDALKERMGKELQATIKR